MNIANLTRLTILLMLGAICSTIQAGPVYRVYATREGLVGHTTANGHVITNNSRFAALPSTKGLTCNGCFGRTVTIHYNGNTVTVPVWDVGPWNTKDDYWNSPRELFQGLPKGKPEAQAAYYDNYNGGEDMFGRQVANPAGIDLSNKVFWDDLGMVNNDWVYVEYNWVPDDPISSAPLYGAPITNLGGWYRIKAKNSSKYFDIAPDHVSNGANLRQNQWTGTSNQVYQLVHLGDGYYKIWAKSAGANRVLDVQSCGTGNGANIQQWDWLGNNCQQFRIEDAGAGYRRIVAKNSGRVMEVAGGSTANGANIQLWDWHGGDNQKFQIEWVSIPVTNLSGAYRVTSAQTGRVLDIAPDHVSNGANLQMYDWIGGNNQKFTFEHLGSGYYKIWALSAGSSRVLDVEGCGTANGSNVHQWTWLNNDCQKFLIEDVGPGQVRIINKNSGKAFDHPVNGGNGSNVYTWDWWGGDNQRWLLQSASSAPPVEVIVDNSDPGFSVSGNWYSSSYTTGFYGTNYHVRSTAAVSDSAAWTVNLPESGSYDVYARWTAGSNRAASAPYIIYYDGGSETVNVNQQTNGGQFVYLGTWNFAAGSSVKVRLSCWTTAGYVVIADAVRFYKQ